MSPFCNLSRIAVIVVAAAFLCAGCSTRPKNGTVVLVSDSTSKSYKNALDLKYVDIQQTGNKLLIGWQGDELLLYNSNGIYSFNYKTLSLATLLFISDSEGRLQYPSLSGNGKKISYFRVGTQANAPWSLYTADADCQTDEENVSRYLGGIASGAAGWSHNGKYIFLPVAGKSEYRILNLSTGTPVTPKNSFSSQSKIYDIDDKDDHMLISAYRNKIPVLCVTSMEGTVIQTLDTDPYLWSYASFIGNGGIAYLSGTTLSIANMDSSRSRQVFGDVSHYAVSSDMNYICVIKTDATDSSDVYVGELQNGEVANLTLIFKGGASVIDAVAFSPDDKRVCISTYEKAAAVQYTVTVLTFQ